MRISRTATRRSNVEGSNVEGGNIEGGNVEDGNVGSSTDEHGNAGRGNRSRRIALQVVAFCALGSLGAIPTAAAIAEEFPTRPIRIVVPFPPGGDIDPVARSLAERFQEAWKQPVTVENRAGGGAIIGTDHVAKSPPDGYTLLLCSVGAMTVNPHLYPNLPYNVAQDIAPVSLIATTPMVLVVNQTVQAKSVAELVQNAKREPGKLTFASAGNGNITHLAGVYFASRAAVDLVHIPYKGSGPAVIDLLGGHVNMYFNPLPSALGYLKEGKARALAVTSARRAESLPEVPTLQEAGYADFDVNSWYGLCAPAGIPPDVLRKLNGEVVKAVNGQPFGDRLRALGTVPSPTSPEKFSEMIREESARWGRLVREYNVKVD